MTEREYIDATNLAKARIASSAWGAMLVMDPGEKEAHGAASRAMAGLIEALEGRVRCDEEEDDNP